MIAPLNGWSARTRHAPLGWGGCWCSLNSIHFARIRDSLTCYTGLACRVNPWTMHENQEPITSCRGCGSTFQYYEVAGTETKDLWPYFLGSNVVTGPKPAKWPLVDITAQEPVKHEQRITFKNRLVFSKRPQCESHL